MDYIIPTDTTYPRLCRDLPLGKIIHDVRNGRTYNAIYQIEELKRIGFELGGESSEGMSKIQSARNVLDNDDIFTKAVSYEHSCKYGELVEKLCSDLVDEEKSVLSKYHMASGLPQLFTQMLCRCPDKRIEIWEVKKKLNDLVLSVGEVAVLRRIEQLSDLFTKRITDLEGDLDTRLDAQDLIINDLKDGLALQSNLLDSLFDKSNLYPRLLLIVPVTSDVNTYARELGVSDISSNGTNFIQNVSTTGMKPGLAHMMPSFFQNFNWKRFFMQEYRVCCICEFTGVVLDSGLKVGMVKEWFKRAAPFIQVIERQHYVISYMIDIIVLWNVV